MTKPHGVYDAGTAVGMTLEEIDRRRVALLEKRALSGLFGIKEIDEYTVPLWPGDLAYITALPSNGKSFVARMLEHRMVNLLLDHGDGGRVAVWITTEESTQKVAAHWLSAMSGVSSTAMLSGKMTEEQQVSLNASVAAVGSWPLYVVGHSTATRNKDGRQEKSARLSMSEIDACLDYIINNRKKDIVVTTLDYIHRVRNDSGSDRESHIRNAVDWTRDIAIWTGGPAIICAQAKQAISQRKYAIPGIPDVEWSMNAGQSADTLIGLWFPKTTMPVKSTIENFAGFERLIVEEDMMFVAVAKQKDGPGGKVFLLRVQPHLMKWELLEAQKVEELVWGQPASSSPDNYMDNLPQWETQTRIEF